MSSLYIRTVGKIVWQREEEGGGGVINSFPQLIYVKMFKDGIYILSPWLFASRTYCVRSMLACLRKLVAPDPQSFLS